MSTGVWMFQTIAVFFLVVLEQKLILQLGSPIRHTCLYKAYPQTEIFGLKKLICSLKKQQDNHASMKKKYYYLIER